MKHLLAAAAVLAIASVASAADWLRYDNARYAYSIEVPPGFGPVEEAQNGDGGVTRSAGGNAELAVWGSMIIDDDFRSEVASRIASDMNDGWDISYDVRRETAASWSGTRNGRILYSRALSGCDGTAGFFRLEMDASAKEAYDPVVTRLVKTFTRPGC